MFLIRFPQFSNTLFCISISFININYRTQFLHPSHFIACSKWTLLPPPNNGNEVADCRLRWDGQSHVSILQICDSACKRFPHSLERRRSFRESNYNRRRWGVLWTKDSSEQNIKLITSDGAQISFSLHWELESLATWELFELYLIWLLSCFFL